MEEVKNTTATVNNVAEKHNTGECPPYLTQAIPTARLKKKNFRPFTQLGLCLEDVILNYRSLSISDRLPLMRLPVTKRKTR
ncbi:hypothetical protein RR46_07244 [Papilio xuthus]|uniref:Uncharacterized protein n=1 Tax=Papilio xuthus TaxID=66420 RepID=A0A194PVZ4_PAPXU|nr:hypothetical protein RR46_07244 [Papilio xuthus]